MRGETSSSAKLRLWSSRLSQTIFNQTCGGGRAEILKVFSWNSELNSNGRWWQEEPVDLLLECCLSVCAFDEEIWPIYDQDWKNDWMEETRQHYAIKHQLRIVSSWERNQPRNRKFDCLPDVDQIWRKRIQTHRWLTSSWIYRWSLLQNSTI